MYRYQTSLSSSYSNLKYFVVFPLFMMQDFTVVLIQLTKSILNSYFWRVFNKKQWLTKSSAFSISIVTRKPSNANLFAIPKISKITLSLLLINLFLTYTIWLEETRKRNTFYILVERTLLIIFISVLNSDIGLQFLMNLLSLSFFQTF